MSLQRSVGVTTVLWLALITALHFWLNIGPIGEPAPGSAQPTLHSLDADVPIVGAGPSGAILASRLPRLAGALAAVEADPAHPLRSEQQPRS